MIMVMVVVVVLVDGWVSEVPDEKKSHHSEFFIDGADNTPLRLAYNGKAATACQW